uniref:Uncharacterized protein n=1 Tax=Oryza nivara TaxID=4536 RepID=A0A0E0G2A9_ORYNI
MAFLQQVFQHHMLILVDLELRRPRVEQGEEVVEHLDARGELLGSQLHRLRLLFLRALLFLPLRLILRSLRLPLPLHLLLLGRSSLRRLLASSAGGGVIPLLPLPLLTRIRRSRLRRLGFHRLPTCGNHHLGFSHGRELEESAETEAEAELGFWRCSKRSERVKYHAREQKRTRCEPSPCGPTRGRPGPRAKHRVRVFAREEGRKQNADVYINRSSGKMPLLPAPFRPLAPAAAAAPRRATAGEGGRSSLTGAFCS